MIDINQKEKILLRKQVKPLFEATPSGAFANIFAAFLAYALLYDTNHRTDGLIMCCGVVLFSILRIYVSKDYLSKNNLELKKHLYTHVLLTFVIGVFWGLYAFLLRQPEDESVRYVFYLINFGLISGSIATLSTYRAAYLAYILPQAIAIISVFLIINTATGLYIAMALLVSTVFMMMTSFSINNSHKHSVLLTYNNKELIGDLNSEIHIREKAQHELEENKRQLEHTVQERTKDLQLINKNLEEVIKVKEQAEESLQYLAYHDELTGLPNRNLLINRIDHSIATADRNKQQMGILFIDLDRFKTINDSLGHVIGDKLIRDVSQRLLKTLRKEDTISRNGGDEFVVVIQRMVNSEEVIGIAQKLIERLTSIFEIDSHKIHIGASVGISIYPTDGDSSLELIRNADTAMFSAKKSGGNRLQFYDESMSNLLHERLSIESELHTALEKKEFFVMYQPQVDSLTGRTKGFEALLRWNNKKLGSVGPAEFVPLLEETGLIYEVGKWIVEEVANFIASGQAKDTVVALNLSALQCGDMKFVRFIDETITKTEINPQQLEFEITESLLINDFEKTEIFLNELHSLGCSIALDDFGTGYTSMSYLTRLPIDCIKVDQSFVRNIDSNPTLENIVKAIVTMSSSLGLRNVFEGVETEAELEAIKKLSGSVVQGYFFSKPLNVDSVATWLTRKHVA